MMIVVVVVVDDDNGCTILQSTNSSISLFIMVRCKSCEATCQSFRFECGLGGYWCVTDQVAQGTTAAPTPTIVPALVLTCSDQAGTLLGDGVCDLELNLPFCAYDAGDCCQSTCVALNGQSCIGPFPTCVDPNASENAPSASPSSAPSVRVTQVAVPSSSPSRAPSRLPSAIPSGLPSRAPSRAPSTLPSRSPSNAPSTLPSRSPSKPPTILPSSGPSKLPSGVPSPQPSSSPSFAPTTLLTKTCKTTSTCGPSSFCGDGFCDLDLNNF